MCHHHAEHGKASVSGACHRCRRGCCGLLDRGCNRSCVAAIAQRAHRVSFGYIRIKRKAIELILAVSAAICVAAMAAYLELVLQILFAASMRERVLRLSLVHGPFACVRYGDRGRWRQVTALLTVADVVAAGFGHSRAACDIRAGGSVNADAKVSPCESAKFSNPDQNPFEQKWLQRSPLLQLVAIMRTCIPTRGGMQIFPWRKSFFV